MHPGDKGPHKEGRALCHSLEQQLHGKISVEVCRSEAGQFFVSNGIVVGVSFELPCAVIPVDQVFRDRAALCDNSAFCSDELWCFPEGMSLLQLWSRSTCIFALFDAVVIFQVVRNLQFLYQPQYPLRLGSLFELVNAWDILVEIQRTSI